MERDFQTRNRGRRGIDGNRISGGGSGFLKRGQYWGGSLEEGSTECSQGSHAAKPILARE